ncbi:MAG: TlpA family protein disulfide reductase [Candidatus Krumholzibacteria bacterium]|nr:TlpA family protein disulfide reductase [Candidatus Krumholzibacteria bacterium]
MLLRRCSRRIIAPATAVAALFLMLSCSGDGGGGEKPAEGAAARNEPAAEEEQKGIVSDVTFRTLDGSEKKISEYGRKILMVNYMTTWSADSKKLIPIMNEVHRKFHANVVVIGVITDVTAGKARAFMKANDVKFEILLPGGDPGWFGTPSKLPVTHVVTREDLIINRFVGLYEADRYEEFILSMYRRRM